MYSVTWNTKYLQLPKRPNYVTMIENHARMEIQAAEDVHLFETLDAICNQEIECPLVINSSGQIGRRGTLRRRLSKQELQKAFNEVNNWKLPVGRILIRQEDWTDILDWAKENGS